jgi:hypothetical protein
MKLKVAVMSASLFALCLLSRVEIEPAYRPVAHSEAVSIRGGADCWMTVSTGCNFDSSYSCPSCSEIGEHCGDTWLHMLGGSKDDVTPLARPQRVGKKNYTSYGENSCAEDCPCDECAATGDPFQDLFCSRPEPPVGCEGLSINGNRASGEECNNAIGVLSMYQEGTLAPHLATAVSHNLRFVK